MKNKNQANKKFYSLFKLPENRENFQLLYKFLSQPAKGLCLCQALPEERTKILGFFDSDPLIERIHVIDMVNPHRGPMELQQTIIDANEKFGPRKDIFFIYNIEEGIHLLKTNGDDFFQGMNLIRDFFMQFKAVFVFFMTETSVKKMIRHAFDFYDWMRFTFTFVSESKYISLQPIVTGEREDIKYSASPEKIDYLKNSIKRVKNEKAKSMRLLELGKLYLHVGDYDAALERVSESLDIEKKYKDLNNMAKRYNEIGLIHKAKGELDEALKYALMALDILVKSNDSISVAKHYNNIGVLYQAQGDLDKALEFVFKALEIFEKNDDGVNTPLVNANIGKIYQSMGDNESAERYFKRAGTAFISFEGRDRAEADRLARHLSEDGIAIWMDQRKLASGEELDEIIIKAIGQCPVFLPLISKNAAQLLTQAGQLKYHIMEWQWVYSRIMSGEDKTIIPVKIDDTKWIYDRYENLFHLKVPGGRREGDYEKLKNKLAEIQRRMRD